MGPDQEEGGGGDGNTPLDEDESEGLIPVHISTRSELNAWEKRNVEEAFAWTMARTPDVLDEAVLKALHKKMFGKTWEWAGEFRRSDKTISPFHWSEVPSLVRNLLANTSVQYERAPASPEAVDALAARFHHELVRIHPWPNGNGRHARLATDLLLRRWGRPPFTWGNDTKYSDDTALRNAYLRALRDADAGTYEGLYRFVRA